MENTDDPDKTVQMLGALAERLSMVAQNLDEHEAEPICVRIDNGRKVGRKVVASISIPVSALADSDVRSAFNMFASMAGAFVNDSVRPRRPSASEAVASMRTNLGALDEEVSMLSDDTRGVEDLRGLITDTKRILGDMAMVVESWSDPAA